MIPCYNWVDFMCVSPFYLEPIFQDFQKSPICQRDKYFFFF